MGKHNSLILIDYNKCPPCSELTCVDVCPLGVLEEGTSGKPQIVDIVSCNLCEICANLCPSKAIAVNQNENKKDM